LITTAHMPKKQTQKLINTKALTLILQLYTNTYVLYRQNICGNNYHMITIC